MVAAHRGRLECAKALLRAGADPNFVNRGGGATGVRPGCDRGASESIPRLAAEGFESCTNHSTTQPAITQPLNGHTPLNHSITEHSTTQPADLAIFWAIDGGVDMIKLFIDYGVDLDARSPKDWTPLSYSRSACVLSLKIFMLDG
jgi:ankyrin repeat protein